MLGSPLQMEGIDLGHVTENAKKNCWKIFSVFFSMGTYALALYSLLFLFCHLHGGDVIEYHSQEHSARSEIRPNTDLTGDSPVNEA